MRLYTVPAAQARTSLAVHTISTKSGAGSFPFAVHTYWSVYEIFVHIAYAQKSPLNDNTDVDWLQSLNIFSSMCHIIYL